MSRFGTGTDINGTTKEVKAERKTDDEIIALRERFKDDPRFERYIWLTSDEAYAKCVPTDDNNMDNMPSVFRHVERIKDIRTVDGNKEVDRQYTCCFTGLKCHINFAVCTRCKIPDYYPTKAKILIKRAEKKYGSKVDDDYDEIY